jgi:hypothetical protein
MEYKGIEYRIARTDSPPGWKWTLFLDAIRTRTGISSTRADAVLDAESAIDKLKEKSEPGLTPSPKGENHP